MSFNQKFSNRIDRCAVMLGVLLLVGGLPSREASAQDGMLGGHAAFEELLLKTLDARTALQSGEFEYEMSKTDSEKTVKWKQKGLYCYDDTKSTIFHYLERFTEDDVKLDRKASFWGGCNFRLPPEQSLLIESTSQCDRFWRRTLSGEKSARLISARLDSVYWATSTEKQPITKHSSIIWRTGKML